MRGKADFSDLTTRVISAVVMLAVGGGAVWVGGDLFAVVLIVAAGLMGWELSRMHCVNQLVPLVFGLLIAAALLCLLFLPLPWAIGTSVLAAGAALLGHQKMPVLVFLGGGVIVVACAGLQVLRGNDGLGWTTWLILVVIATDVGGYFAGKLIGGPKIWPKVSPKKTWSGTVGGWILAALVGYGAFMLGLAVIWIVPVSVAISFFSQLGDMAESAIKRHAGVKDSSGLIPGHGGLLDRFDALMGAGLLVAIGLVLGIA